MKAKRGIIIFIQILNRKVLSIKKLKFLLTNWSICSIRSKRAPLPSVSHESIGQRFKGEKKSPARRLDRRRSERIIGNYTSDTRYPFSRQPSISEELPTMKNNSSPKHRLDRKKIEYTDSDKTLVPEWLRKNPLQLHYINNCERNRNDLRDQNGRQEHLEFNDDDFNYPRKKDSGELSSYHICVL